MRIVLALFLLGCGGKSDPCATLGAPQAATLRVSFQTATTANFAIDGNAITTASCVDDTDLGACQQFIIPVDGFSIGTHTLSVDATSEPLHTATFTMSNGTCGGHIATPDSFSF